MRKENWITILIIVAILLVFVYAMRSGGEDVRFAKCLSEKSVLYVQKGCSACEIQKRILGNSYKSMNIIDCFYERDKCLDITHTPTWIINGKKVEGVQPIKELKRLSGC